MGSFKIFFSMFIVIFGSLHSCSNSLPEELFFELPLHFRMEGEARGRSEGVNIECGMNLIVTLNPSFEESGRSRLYRGTKGGELYRTATDDEGDGISLIPNVFAEIEITQLKNGSIEIHTPVKRDTGSRFYDALEFIQGDGEDGEIDGMWTCAPFDTREDTVGTIEGSWRVVELPDPD